jgi:NAD(P)H-nitrite reductase large subunit
MSKPPSSQPPLGAAEQVDLLESPGADATICYCHSVTVRQILAEIGRGATTLAEIRERTRATTGCGGCEWDVLDLLKSV